MEATRLNRASNNLKEMGQIEIELEGLQQEVDILEVAKEKIKYLEQLIEEINEVFDKEVNEEDLDEHKAKLVQKLLELGADGYTFEDLRKDVEAFELETKTRGIEQTKKALTTPNVTRKEADNLTQRIKKPNSHNKGQAKIIDIYEASKGKNLPKN